jgi:uncharacterized membrane protein
MCKNSCEWFDSTSRLKAWDLINKEDTNNQGLLYERLMKQYEIIGIVSALITATLGMVLDNKNISDDYKTVYDLINGIGMIFSLTGVVNCLIITTLLSAIEKKNVYDFLKNGAMFLSIPLICIMVGLFSMYVCVTMYFGGFKAWILFPISFILYFLSFIFYIYQRCYLLKVINRE